MPAPSPSNGHPTADASDGLLAYAQRILHLAERVRDAQRVAREAERYYERKERVDGLVEELEPLVRAQRLLAEAEIPFKGTPHGAGTYSDTAARYRDVDEAFNADPSSVFGTPFREAAERTDKIVTGLRRRLLEGWAAYVDRVVPMQDPEQLEVFARLPAFAEVVDQLLALYRDRAALAEQLPQTEEDVRAPEALASRVEDAWLLLGGKAPEAVLDLLRAADSRAGAPLSALTDEVRAWLEEHDLTDALRLRLAP